jgi:5-methylcytosine-specific restriction endonuclease McrA
MVISKKKRLFVGERAYYCCEYCQCIAEFIPVPFVMEHIIPAVKGGLDEVDNLAFACHHCNGAKYSKTEVFDEQTNQIVPLFHPRKNKWTTHFA